MLTEALPEQQQCSGTIVNRFTKHWREHTLQLAAAMAGVERNHGEGSELCPSPGTTFDPACSNRTSRS